MNDTPLDRAWRAAEAQGAGDAEMAEYYDTFAGVEFFLALEPDLLESEAPQPLLFSVEGAPTALIFDTEIRMANFLEAEAAHLALSGRAVISMFTGRGVQLGVNLGDAPSATILPAAAVDWAATALRQPIEAETGGRAALQAPVGVKPELLARIDAKLAGMAGLVRETWLCGVGEGALALCVLLEQPAAENAVVSALAETARFAGGEGAAFDIAVVEDESPALSMARKVGFGFDLSAPPAPAPLGPGMDPSAPPKLR